MNSEKPSRIMSKKFAIRIVRLFRYLVDERKEVVLSKQVLRSGTSIGANLAEAECAISRNDFASKVYIARKECAETEYWLDLLHETDYLSHDEYSSIMADCSELMRMLTATTKTLSQVSENESPYRADQTPQIKEESEETSSASN